MANGAFAEKKAIEQNERNTAWLHKVTNKQDLHKTEKQKITVKCPLVRCMTRKEKIAIKQLNAKTIREQAFKTILNADCITNNSEYSRNHAQYSAIFISAYYLL